MPIAFDSATLRFGLHQERRDAPTPPCKCHDDLFAPDHPVDANKMVEPAPDALDAAVEKVIQSDKATRDEWKADANEMLGLLTLASKEQDVNHMLTTVLLQKLREHINRA